MTEENNFANHYLDRELNKSGVYDKSDNKSGLYDNTSEQNTGKYNGKSDDSNYESKSIHNISINDEIILSDLKYIILDVISSNTGEGIIYKMADPKGKLFALKLYFPFANMKEEPNFETLSRISQFDDPDILKLYSFGTNQNKYLNKFCYEISDYAEGGNLFDVKSLKTKYNYEFLKKYVVPQMLLGLTKLHSYGIVHGDIKPNNIFYKDKEQTDLIIGDYGSAKSYDLQDPKPLHVTSAFKGTNYYMSTDQSKGIMRIENDYFSFGMVLFHLMYPEHFSYDDDFRLVDKEKYERITEVINAHVPLIDFDDDYKDLNTLVAGLTLGDTRNRWGKKEVQNWLNGDYCEVVYSNLGHSIQIKISNYTIRNYKDLEKYITSNENWYEDLIEDKESYSLLLSLVMQIENREKKVLFNELITMHRQDGMDIIKSCILMFTNPKNAITYRGYSFNLSQSTNIRKDIAKIIGVIDESWKTSDLNDIKKTIFELELSLRLILLELSQKNKEAIEMIIAEFASVIDHELIIDFSKLKCEIFSTITDNYLIKLFYFYNPERVFIDSTGTRLNNIEEIALFFASNEKLYGNNFFSLELNLYLEKIHRDDLKSLTYKDFLYFIFRDHAVATIEITNVSLDYSNNSQIRINYKYSLSLNDFFENKNINQKVSKDTGDRTLYYTYHKRFFTPLYFITSSFIKEACEKNNISKEVITKRNREEIRRQLKEAIYAKFNIFTFLIAITLSVVMGWCIGYLILQSQIIPETINANKTNIILLTLICLFAPLLTLGIFNIKRRAKLSGVSIILLSIIPLALFVNTIVVTFSESNKIINFRHNFYVNNLLLDTGEEKEITVYKMLSVLKDDILNRNDYIPFVNGYINNDIFYTTSKSKILEREFYDLGFLKSYEVRFKDVYPSVLSTDRKICESKSFIRAALLADISDYRVAEHYSLRLKYDIKSYSDENFSAAGFRINRFLILSDKNTVKLISEEPFPENPNDDEYRFFVISGQSKSNSYLTRYKKGSVADNIPLGISNKVLTSKILSEAYILKSDGGWITVDIVMSKDNILIKVNDVDLINYSGNLDFDTKYFKSNLMTCYEPLADYSIANASIFKLDENSKYDKGKEVDIHKYTKLTAMTNEDVQLFKESSDNSIGYLSIPKNTKVEVLYEDNNRYFVNYEEKEKTGFVNKDGINNFKFEDIQ
ncbi:MAG: protein kinase [Ignavibacteria bacterium]|nr:protein kinase [Ignavibacteria bacterium]